MKTSIKLIIAFLLFIVVLACQKNITSMRTINSEAKTIATSTDKNQDTIFDFAHENRIFFKFSTSKKCINSSIEIFDADPLLGGQNIVETKFLNNIFEHEILIPAYTNIIYVKIKNEIGTCRSFAVPVYGKKVEFCDS